jgi:hypothetical protein
MENDENLVQDKFWWTSSVFINLEIDGAENPVPIKLA